MHDPCPWTVVHALWLVLQEEELHRRLDVTENAVLCRRTGLGMLLAVLAAVSRGTVTQRAAAAHAALQTPTLPRTVCSTEAVEYVTVLKVSLVTPAGWMPLDV